MQTSRTIPFAFRFRGLFVDRPQNSKEELLNALSGAVGLLGAACAGVFLLIRGEEVSGSLWMTGIPVFVACLVFLHLASTIYHAVPAIHPAKRILVKCDHTAILFLIAGSYTPFLLAVEGAFPLLVIEWALALGGSLLLWVRRDWFKKISTPLYLVMGWLGLVFYPVLLQGLPMSTVLWILAGGAAYTIGVLFYSMKQAPFFHAVWHLFVIAGSACHVIAVLALISATAPLA